MKDVVPDKWCHILCVGPQSSFKILFDCDHAENGVDDVGGGVLGDDWHDVFDLYGSEEGGQVEEARMVDDVNA